MSERDKAGGGGAPLDRGVRSCVKWRPEKHGGVELVVIGLKWGPVQESGRCKGPEAGTTFEEPPMAGRGQSRDLWAKRRPESEVPLGVLKMSL